MTADGSWRVLGQAADASNATLVLERDGRRYVYKPVAGERPLWDFPDGTLALREVAAYRVAAQLDWNCVPPTRWFDDAPYGPGSVQDWVGDATGFGVAVFPEGQVPPGWLGVLHGYDERDAEIEVAHRDSPAIRRLALFDLVTNNADRKGSHVFELADGSVRGIDHGLCFAVEPKLRTVLWGFAGQPIERTDLAAVAALVPHAADLLTGLSADEVSAFVARIEALLAAPGYPQPDRQPPAIPWPPI